MKRADALSRLPTILFLEEIQGISRAEVIDAQREDKELSVIIKILSIPDQIDKATRDKLKTSVEKSFLSEDGLLLRNVGPKGKPWEHESLHWRVWVPEAMRNATIKLFTIAPQLVILESERHLLG